MKRQTWMAALLSLMLLGSFVPQALAEIFHRTITLGPGAGQFTIEDLGVGDTMVLTLVNPTNQPLMFSTTQQIGGQQEWVIPPNSQQTVEFNYTVPFDDDVEFVVQEVGTPTAPGRVVAQGTLIPVERPAAYERPAVRDGRMAAPVRGYW